MSSYCDVEQENEVTLSQHQFHPIFPCD